MVSKVFGEHWKEELKISHALESRWTLGAGNVGRTQVWSSLLDFREAGDRREQPFPHTQLCRETVAS